jgi:hypothetical protein
MALYFPDTPAIGDEFENGFVKWIWDGIKWTGGGAVEDMTPYLPLTGGTMTGPLAVSDANLAVAGGTSGQLLTTDGSSNLTWQDSSSSVNATQLLAVLAVDGPLLSNSTPTSLLPVAAKFNAPANFFTVGKTCRLQMSGFFYANVLGCTFAFDIQFGGTTTIMGGFTPLQSTQPCQTSSTCLVSWPRRRRLIVFNCSNTLWSR